MLDEAIPFSHISAETVPRWISRFGSPVSILTDKERQFRSALYKAVVDYHSQANGKIKHWHRILKIAIKAHGHEPWTEISAFVVLLAKTPMLPPQK